MCFFPQFFFFFTSSWLLKLLLYVCFNIVSFCYYIFVNFILVFSLFIILFFPYFRCFFFFFFFFFFLVFFLFFLVYFILDGYNLMIILTILLSLEIPKNTSCWREEKKKAVTQTQVIKTWKEVTNIRKRRAMVTVTDSP